MPSRRKEREKLTTIKRLVARGAYHYSKKVQTMIENGCFRLQDVESCVMSADQICKTEVDELGNAVDGCKHTILGMDAEGYDFYTCGKIIPRGKGQELYFFITAHEDDPS